MGIVSEWTRIETEENGLRWEVKDCEKDVEYYAFKLTSLPNFTDPRFEYLCKEIDSRPTEVAKQQLQALRHIHRFGNKWTITLRIKKTEKLTLYIIKVLVKCLSHEQAN